MAEIGYLALFIAFFVTFYTMGAYFVAIRAGNRRMLESARGGVAAVTLLTTVAFGALMYLMVTSDFRVKYVSNYTSLDLPLAYKIGALWAGQEGSLLLWIWILMLFTFIVTFLQKGEGEEMIPAVSGILMTIASFFFFILVFVTSPFAKLNYTPADGYGLNPLLQNPGMFLHPLTQYLGYVGFSVPYAFAMVALLTRNTGDVWIRVTRRWTLIAWLFLTWGILYGAIWAYMELGWGGYWAWDPVENASFMPWLTGTAFFHSVMIQERRGMMKTWNVVLIILTFILTIFGTFLTRSGILASVHAFGETTLGLYFLVFIGSVIFVSLYVLFDRMPYLRENRQLESLLSKESSFLLNNLLFVAAAFAVFWGTIFPIISKAVRGVEVTVGPPFFNRVFVPIAILLLIITGICPLIAWRRSSWQNLREHFTYPFVTALLFALVAFLLGVTRPWVLLTLACSVFVAATIYLEFHRGVRVRRKMTGETVLLALGRLVNRSRRRYGGYLVHFGVIIMAAGIAISSGYAVEKTVSLERGQAVEVKDYRLVFQGLGQRPVGISTAVYGDMEVYKGGRKLGILRPEKLFHPREENPYSEVAVMGGLKEDLYLILAGWENQDQASFKVLVNPAVAWIWIGAYVLTGGTILAIWPQRRAVLRGTRPGIAETAGETVGGVAS